MNRPQKVRPKNLIFWGHITTQAKEWLFLFILHMFICDTVFSFHTVADSLR